MRIVLTGGGTGGHVLPFESIIEALRTTYTNEKGTLPGFLDPEDLQLYFFGVTTPEINELFKRYDVPVKHIPSGKMRRYASSLNVIDILFRLPIGIIMALWHMWQIMPDVVVSKGGYGSVPSVLAAFFYRIPILLHESDVVPGSANKSLMNFASAISIGFAVSKEYLPKVARKLFLTGTPVRSVGEHHTKASAKKSFGFSESEPLLLVMGGSQGAKQINEALLTVLPNILNTMSVLHITGTSQYEAVSGVTKEMLMNSPRKDAYKNVAYLGETMVSALVAADIIVARAGASSLAEIARLRIPSLLIPLADAANDHQRKNALAFEAAGAALILDPSNLSPHLLEQGILRLVSDKTLQETLSKNLIALDFPNAATDIAKLVFQLATGYRPV